jgi:hypothetical protein
MPAWYAFKKIQKIDFPNRPRAQRGKEILLGFYEQRLYRKMGL